MTMTVAIIAQGAMGSGVAARLTRHGVTVLTSLTGRGVASRERAEAAGMRHVEDEQIAAQAKLLLSIVPPAEALALAERFVPLLGRPDGPVFVDCNAIRVSTVKEIGRIMADAGVPFADGAITGAPPKGDDAGPTLHFSGVASGAAHERLTALAGFGLRIRFLDGPVGAASAMKLAYSGIVKGLTALGTAMILAAERAGAGQALKEELLANRPQLLARFEKALPEMYPKAYRWVEEMRAIADFIGDGFPEAGVFDAVAQLYARIAEDAAGARTEIGQVEKFFQR